VVLALPTDGRHAYAFDAATAAELWRVAINDPIAKLVGVIDGRVMLSNRGLQVRALTTGELLVENVEAQLTGWPALRRGSGRGSGSGRGNGSGRGSSSGNGSGRGEVVWPHDARADTFGVNAASSPYAGCKLPEPGGANLLVAGDYLVAAGPSQLSVFRYQDRAETRPQDSPTSLNE
jgi:hypothetical protein